MSYNAVDVDEYGLTRYTHRAATKEEIEKSGVTVAALFFKNVFGEKAQKALTVFVALRYAPNLPSPLRRY